jgi:hypothetical protein
MSIDSAIRRQKTRTAFASTLSTIVADASRDKATLAVATSRASIPKLMEGMRCASTVVVASTLVSAESLSAKRRPRMILVYEK